MECVLLWLDEIDDLVFAGISFWRRLSPPSLALVLAAVAAVNALSWLAIA